MRLPSHTRGPRRTIRPSQCLVQLLGRDLCQALCDLRVRGVVDEDIETAQLSYPVVHRFDANSFIANVAWERSARPLASTSFATSAASSSFGGR